jgi:hypothetical protein
VYLLGQFTYAGPFSTSASDVCKPIKDMGHKSLCYDKMKAKHHSDYLSRCEDVTEMTEKIAPHKWENINHCLDIIATLQPKDIPKKQLKFCDNLLEYSRNTTYMLYCMQPFDENLLELCALPLEKKNYGVTYECLKLIQGYKADRKLVDKLKVECVKPDPDQPLRIFSWATYTKCITLNTNKSDVPRTETVVDPDTGEPAQR